MIGDGLHVDVAIERQVSDRDQDGIFDAGEADHPGMSAADALVMRGKSEQGVHQMAEPPVAAIGQQLGPRDRERHRRRVVAGGPRPGAARVRTGATAAALLAGQFIATG